MPTASTRHSTQSDALVAALEHSDSAVVYVDIDGMTDAGAAELLLAEPALYLEFDQVRQKWAVRYATSDEAADAQAASDETAPKTGAHTIDPALVDAPPKGHAEQR